MTDNMTPDDPFSGSPVPPPPPAPQQPTPPPPGAYYASQQSTAGGKNDPFAITAMTTGIVGAVMSLCCYPLGIVLGVIATIFGALSLGRIKKGQYKGHGMAMTGIILGIIALVISLVWIALVITGAANTTFEFNK